MFLKATSVTLNADSARLARQEIRANRLLGDVACAPRLLVDHDDGEWVATVFESVAGRHPEPWTRTDLTLVLAAVRELSVPVGPDGGVPLLSEVFAEDFAGWRKLAAAGIDPASIEPWLDAPGLARLAEVEARWTEVVVGDDLVHADLRADNVLLDSDGDGGVRLLDWANAGVGPRWFDVVCLAPSVALEGEVSAEEVWAMSGFEASVAPEALAAAVVAVAGYFTEAGRRPPIPVIPMLRGFQEAQGLVARAWARELLGLD